MTVQATAQSIAELRYKVGRGLLACAAIATAAVFVVGFTIVAHAHDDRVWVEVWRTTAYGVFAGLFALLAHAPRSQRAIWLLVFGQKLALVIFGALLGDVNEARQATLVDLALVAILVASFILCRGWYAWRKR
jgi:hypothetical protein